MKIVKASFEIIDTVRPEEIMKNAEEWKEDLVKIWKSML